MMERKNTSSSDESFAVLSFTSDGTSFSSDSSLLATPASSVAGDSAEWMNLDETQLWDSACSMRNRFDCTLNLELDPMSTLTYEMQCAFDKMGSTSSTPSLNMISDHRVTRPHLGVAYQPLPPQHLVSPQDLRISHTMAPLPQPTVAYAPIPSQCIMPEDTTSLESCELTPPSHASLSFEIDTSDLYDEPHGPLTCFDGISDSPMPWTPKPEIRDQSRMQNFSQRSERAAKKLQFRQQNLERQFPSPASSKLSGIEDGLGKEAANAAPRPRRNKKYPVLPNFPCDVRRRGERRCSFCDRYFERKEHLKRHERTHLITLDEKIPCKFCGKRFDRLDNLRAHVILHTVKKKSSRTAYHAEALLYYQALRQKSVQGRRAAKRVKVEPVN